VSVAAAGRAEPAEEARRRAAETIEEARALRAQSAHQLRRARKNQRAGVLAVDDSEIFLRVADSVLSSTTGLRLVGTASSGEEAIELLPELEPDLVLLDIHMPGLDGFATARIIARESPQTVVVLVSAEPAGLEADAESAGAVALLGKMGLLPSALDDLWLKHRPSD
jgi:CheY-like chemotaxis protein